MVYTSLTDVSYAGARLEPATPARTESWAGSHSIWHLPTGDTKGKKAEKNEDTSHALATLGLHDSRFA